MASNTQGVPTAPGHMMSAQAMKIIIWTGFAICLLAFCTRGYIRWICFRRAMPEDWMMLLALGAMLGSAIVTQLRLDYAYEVRDVASGIIPVPPTIFEDVYKAVRGIFAQVMLTQIGIYAIKLSCLIFFYRLGSKITEYLVHWWFVAIVTLACFAVSLGLFEYRCSLSSLDVVLAECSSKADINRMWRSAMISCVADAFSDVLLISLPITILWNITIAMRKKIMLSAIFCLTLFTVAVTIIRGAVHNEQVAGDFSDWVWFWLSIEFISAYIITCLISFRMLFVKNEKSSSARARALHNPQQHHDSSPHLSVLNKRRRRFLDSLLDTFHSWEGTTRTGRSGFFLDNTVPSGRMTVDFMEYEVGERAWQRKSAIGENTTEVADSEVKRAAMAESLGEGEANDSPGKRG